ncbi:MAG: hypothetical protein ACOCUD_01640 [Bacillota bacterium]
MKDVGISGYLEIKKNQEFVLNVKVPIGMSQEEKILKMETIKNNFEFRNIPKSNNNIFMSTTKDSWDKNTEIFPVRKLIRGTTQVLQEVGNNCCCAFFVTSKAREFSGFSFFIKIGGKNGENF